MREKFHTESWPAIQENKLKRNEYFHMLRKLKSEFLRDTLNAKEAPTDFTTYVENKIGISIQYQGSMITEFYTVIDKEKYFLYKLKE